MAQSVQLRTELDTRFGKSRANLFGRTKPLLRQTSRSFTVDLLLVGMSRAQQPSQEPSQPALHVQTDLVIVPLQVHRGSRPVSDLKPSDVVLLEDGAPRAFTLFEAPPDHPSLELVVMFDVTDMPHETDTPKQTAWKSMNSFWSSQKLHDLADQWNEAIARALLEEPGATIRISVYQFDQSRLRRLKLESAEIPVDSLVIAGAQPPQLN